MEHLTQESRVWRNPDTKEITRKEAVRTCKISDADIQRMNKQNFGSSITGAAEFYYEVIKQSIPDVPTFRGKEIDEYTVRELKAIAESEGVELESIKKADIMAELNETLN
jgi:hypothetical protein